VKLLFPGIIIFTAILFITLGVLVKYHKAYWLISGYNTMSPEKRKNVDVLGLSKFICKMSFVLAAIMLIALVFSVLGKETVSVLVFALIVPVSIIIIIKAQTYDGNTKNHDGTMKKSAKLIVGGISGFLVITMVGIGVLFYYSYQPNQKVIAEGSLEIKGLYGEKIAFTDINDIDLKDDLPPITFKANGSSLGNKKKGYFNLQSVGQAKLYVNTSSSPFIFIKGDEKLVIINFDDEQETRELFKSLMTEWEK